jgi:hypothetical protein
MADDLLTAMEAARRLGISKSRLYEWLGLSNAGRFAIRGRPVTIDYFQGGPKGQGPIRIAAKEVERLVEATRVLPVLETLHRPVDRRPVYPGITVELGLPSSPRP